MSSKTNDARLRTLRGFGVVTSEDSASELDKMIANEKAHKYVCTHDINVTGLGDIAAGDISSNTYHYLLKNNPTMVDKYVKKLKIKESSEKGKS